jgi:predicted outer membrane repeat protein
MLQRRTDLPTASNTRTGIHRPHRRPNAPWTPRRRALRLAALLAAASLLIVTGCSTTNPLAPSEPVTLLVDPTGAGDHVTIQAALNEAVSGDTVLVVPGTYAGPSNRDLDFGGEDIVLAATSGRDSVVIDCEGEGRGFHLHRGESRAAVIDGFVVVNGQAERGGGAFFDGTSPTVRNCRFENNSAGLEGGGVHCRRGSPALEGVAFHSNQSLTGTGGGFFCRAGSPTLTDVDFTENTAGSGGGASFILADGTLMEVRFIGNEAGTVGGGIYCGSSSPTIDEVTFLSNRSFVGGAVGLSGSSSTITHATLVNNEATTGAGFYCSNGTLVTIRTSIIALNLGSGIYCTGGSGDDTQQSCLYANLEPDRPAGGRQDNIYLDPLFCDLGGGDLTLCENSPCLPAGNQWGLRIGDRGQGCGECQSSLRSSPWGVLGALHR